jgi:hypothetical protein
LTSSRGPFKTRDTVTSHFIRSQNGIRVASALSLTWPIVVADVGTASVVSVVTRVDL